MSHIFEKRNLVRLFKIVNISCLS